MRVNMAGTSTVILSRLTRPGLSRGLAFLAPRCSSGAFGARGTTAKTRCATVWGSAVALHLLAVSSLVAQPLLQEIPLHSPLPVPDTPHGNESMLTEPELVSTCVTECRRQVDLLRVRLGSALTHCRGLRERSIAVSWQNRPCHLSNITVDVHRQASRCLGRRVHPHRRESPDR